MSNLNKVMIIGRLGDEPSSKRTKNNGLITRFSVATNERWRDKKSGEIQERTDWHRIVTFNRLAEICDEFLSKGTLVYVEGKLQTRSYEKDGNKYYITEVVANEMKMLDPKERNNLSPTPGPSKENCPPENQIDWSPC